ncbi:uncharacterized protein LOC126251669 isoform X3 [Schistocerca nitens]|uniref:uncharacterized protein LOC126251669 isoform X3 n=1 Tax=Schistocerca nitens TaxID=7011 RepID=UPI0021191E08|nr:uncharacterized protein LOC126251669 isoform X3 [Schistocerca nitens]
MDQTTAYFTRRHIYALATDVKIRHQHLTAKTKVLSTTTTTTTTTGAGFDSQLWLFFSRSQQHSQHMQLRRQNTA